MVETNFTIIDNQATMMIAIFLNYTQQMLNSNFKKK